MSPFQTMQIPRWGGHNGDENPAALAQGELQDELNVYLRGETLGTRPGTSYDDQYTSSFSPGGAVQGVFEARTAFDATRNLIVMANGIPHAIGDSGGTATPTSIKGAATISAGQDNLWYFAQMKDAVYMVGGTSGDTALLKWTVVDEGTSTGSLGTVSSVAITGTSERPKYIFQKWNRLWTNGYGGTAPDDNEMIGRFSALNDGDTHPEANTIGGASIVGGFSAFGSEFATGWAEYEDNEGDWLLFLSNRRIYAVSQTGNLFAPFAKTDNINAGCVGPKAFVNLGTDAGDAIWASEKGIHSIRQSQEFGGRESAFLSWKIRDIWKTLNPNRLKFTLGAYWPDEEMVLFAVSTGSSTSHDLILCLDVKSQGNRQELTAEGARWYQWRLSGSLNDDINYMQPARDQNGQPLVYCGTTGGKVISFTASVFSDIGSPYAARFVTADYDFRAPGVRKTMGRVFAKLQPGGSYQPKMRVRFDYGAKQTAPIPLDMPTNSSMVGTAIVGTDVVSSAQSTLREVVRPYGSGETVGFEFSHSTGDQPFWVASLAHEIEAQGITEGLEAA